jgi:hypothetical protein
MHATNAPRSPRRWISQPERTIALLGLIVLACTAMPAFAEEGLRLIEVKKVWDRAPHNAFTDLRRFEGRWYLTFREAPVHTVPEVGQAPGKARVLVSDDGEQWQSAALLEAGENQDVRDPKLSVTPDGRLMLLAAIAPHKQPGVRQPLVWFSNDGQTFEGPQRVAERGWWLWRITWGPDDRAYGVSYGSVPDKGRVTRLYLTTDGQNYQTLLPQFTDVTGTNETTIRFLHNGTALALVRRDGGSHRARLGQARHPYTDWSFQPLDVRLGGPNFIQLPDGRLIGAARFYQPKPHTAVFWLDREKGQVTKALTLPSGGDTSYPGLVWHEDRLWVSYYASHEGKTSIYLAEIAVPDAGE